MTFAKLSFKDLLLSLSLCVGVCVYVVWCGVACVTYMWEGLEISWASEASPTLECSIEIS